MADDDQLFGPEHVRVYQETDGERGYNWRGTTILLLSTEGRSSGTERTTPLIHRSDADRWVIVASSGGAPDHPAWYKNLRADPAATIQVKGERIPVDFRPRRVSSGSPLAPDDRGLAGVRRLPNED